MDAWPVVATAALQCALPRGRPSDSPCYQQLGRSNAPHEFAVSLALALRNPDFPLVHREVTAALVQVGATLLDPAHYVRRCSYMLIQETAANHSYW